MATPLKVLISEDREDDALLIVDELSHSGYQVEWKRVETPAEMRAALSGQPWDLIIADHDLPQFTATGALAICKEFGRDIPFLIVSGAMREIDAVAGMRAGVHDYLLKNNLTRLAPVVDRELREAEVRSQRRAAGRILRRQAQVLDQVNDAVIQTDLSGRILKWNLGAERIYGYTEPEAVGQPVAMLYFAEDAGRAGLPMVFDLVKNRGRHEAELRNRHKSGAVRWIHLSLSLLRDEDDLPYGIVSYSQDVTERRMAELALRESEERYRLLTEALPQMIWVARFDSGRICIEFCNRQVLAYTGLTSEQLKAGAWRSAIHPEDDPPVAEVMSQACQAGIAYEVKHRIRRGSDGAWRWHLARCSPYPDAEGNLRWLGTVIDVEDQTRTEEALRKSEKLAVVGRLASSIAHEINNPLAALTNVLFLLKSTPLSEAQADYVRIASDELARVSHITTQTLRFHRQSSRPIETDVTEILDSVIDLYHKRLMNSGIAAVRQYKTQQPLLCYPGELRQLFANLIGNAFDATRHGGRIVLRVRAIKSWGKGTEGIRVTIADTGHGMAPETCKRIFEPFFTTKDINGTGLGLWVSSEIVQKHGGAFAVRSRAGDGRTGTVFSIFFPLHNYLLAQKGASAGIVTGTGQTLPLRG